MHSFSAMRDCLSVCLQLKVRSATQQCGPGNIVPRNFIMVAPVLCHSVGVTRQYRHALDLEGNKCNNRHVLPSFGCCARPAQQMCCARPAQQMCCARPAQQMCCARPALNVAISSPATLPFHPLLSSPLTPLSSTRLSVFLPHDHTTMHRFPGVFSVKHLST